MAIPNRRARDAESAGARFGADAATVWRCGRRASSRRATVTRAAGARSRAAQSASIHVWRQLGRRREQGPGRVARARGSKPCRDSADRSRCRHRRASSTSIMVRPVPSTSTDPRPTRAIAASSTGCDQARPALCSPPGAGGSTGAACRCTARRRRRSARRRPPARGGPARAPPTSTTSCPTPWETPRGSVAAFLENLRE
jgi:hypothetical protein